MAGTLGYRQVAVFPSKIELRCQLFPPAQGQAQFEEQVHG